MERIERGGRVARKAEGRHIAVEHREHGGFARFQGNAVEINFSEGGQDAVDVVPLPDGRAAGDDEEVTFLPDGVDRFPQSVFFIGHDRVRFGVAAKRFHRGRERDRVDVADLGSFRGLGVVHQFIAGRQDADGQGLADFELRNAERREDGRMAGLDQGALRDSDTAERDVIAFGVDILAGRDRFQHVAELVAEVFRVLDHDDGIGPVRDLAAGRHLHAGALRQDAFLVFAHEDLARIGDHGGQRFGTAVGVRGVDRKPVHSGAGIGRQVFGAQDVLRDDFAECL